MLVNRIRALVQMSTIERRIATVVIAVGVMFASLGLGEAVYRVLFFDFDGATDRLPIEMVFGCFFAYVAAQLFAKLYRKYKRNSTRVHAIRDRNEKIRRALEAISPAPYP